MNFNSIKQKSLKSDPKYFPRLDFEKIIEKLPNGYDRSIIISSSAYQKMCKDMQDINTTISVRSKGYHISFLSDAESIYLGDDYLKVIESLGSPNKIIEKKKLNEQYELLVYKIDNIKYRLFYKNKVLIDVERE